MGHRRPSSLIAALEFASNNGTLDDEVFIPLSGQRSQATDVLRGCPFSSRSMTRGRCDPLAVAETTPLFVFQAVSVIATRE